MISHSSQGIKSILTSKKVSFEIKLQFVCASLDSICSYNIERWEINKELENKIYRFQRKIISKKYLYKLTNQIEWSKKRSHRGLGLFYHVARLPEEAQAKVTFYNSIRDIKKPKGKLATT